MSAKYWFGDERKKAVLRRIPSTRCSTALPIRPRTIGMPCPGVVCCTETPVWPRSRSREYEGRPFLDVILVDDGDGAGHVEGRLLVTGRGNRHLVETNASRRSLFRLLTGGRRCVGWPVELLTARRSDLGAEHGEGNEKSKQEA